MGADGTQVVVNGVTINSPSLGIADAGSLTESATHAVLAVDDRRLPHTCRERHPLEGTGPNICLSIQLLLEPGYYIFQPFLKRDLR